MIWTYITIMLHNAQLLYAVCIMLSLEMACCVGVVLRLMCNFLIFTALFHYFYLAIPFHTCSQGIYSMPTHAPGGFMLASTHSPPVTSNTQTNVCCLSLSYVLMYANTIMHSLTHTPYHHHHHSPPPPPNTHPPMTLATQLQGSEVQISYLGRGALRPVSERRQDLSDGYEFVCGCARCRAEAGEVAAEAGAAEGNAGAEACGRMASRVQVGIK